MNEISKAWAIRGQINGHPGPYFLGIFNFFGSFIGSPLEDCQDGMRTGLFRTRKKAREAAKKNKWAKARAVRVVVEIREEKKS